MGQSDWGFAPWKDNHLLGPDFKSTGFCNLSGNRLPQANQSLGITVMGVVQVQLPFDLILDVDWNREIGLPQVEFDHWRTFFFNSDNMRTDLERVFGVDFKSPVSVKRHGIYR